MKARNIVMIAAIALASLSGCKKKGIYSNFETSYSFKAIVPANSLISTPLFPGVFEEESDAEGQFAINDTRKDLVEEVYVKSFLLEVQSPANQDLSFLNSAKFYINADEEPEMLVAYKDPVPSNVGRDLLLDVDQVNLAPYIRKDPFTIRTQVVTDENRSQDIELKGTVKFQVKAKIIGFD